MTTFDAARARAHVSSGRERIFADLATMVSFNSVHGDPELVEECAASARWVADAFGELGFAMDIIEGVDGSYAVYGKKEPAPGAPTVLLYSHHDVVPTGPREDWEIEPLELTPREGADGRMRWHGRGTADCKGNIAMHLAALRAVQDQSAESGLAGFGDLGIVIVVEGSEENGGAGLSDLLENRPELFDADAIMVADTGNATCGVPSLISVLRGGAQLRVDCRTLTSPAHSGKFGGAAPDAVAALMRTLDSLRDEDGACVIDGIDCTGTWDGTPYSAQKFSTDAGVVEDAHLLGEAEQTGDASDYVWARPAVTVTGFSSTPVELAVNAVPAVAHAQLNLRVPPRLRDSSGKAINSDAAAKLLADHLHNHVPWGAELDVEVLETSQAFAADTSGPTLTLLRECLSEAYGATTQVIGTGGSIPLTVELAEHFPDADIALLGVADTSAAIHSPDESVDPGEIEGMAIAEALFMAQLAQRK